MDYGDGMQQLGALQRAQQGLHQGGQQHFGRMPDFDTDRQIIASAIQPHQVLPPQGQPGQMHPGLQQMLGQLMQRYHGGQPGQMPPQGPPMQGMPQPPMQGMPQPPMQGMPQPPMQGMPQPPMQGMPQLAPRFSQPAPQMMPGQLPMQGAPFAVMPGGWRG